MIKTTVNNEEKEIEQIRLPDGRYVDYVDVKVGDNYQRVFTSTRTIKKNTDTNNSYKSLDNEDSTLKNYRIYGNTVDGESVGDRTANLFDITSFFNSITSCTHGTWSHTSTDFTINATANDCYLNPFGGSNAYKVPVMPNTVYTLSFQLNNPVNTMPCNIIIAENGLIQSGYIHQTSVAQNAKYTITTRNDAEFVTFRFGVGRADTQQTFSGIMFNEGSTPLPYEPYGYKVPVTISNGTDTLTTPIYLPEQIKKVGDEAEYIDYGEQKFHRISGADLDVTLPALPTLAGTNVLSVGTEVRPSVMEVKGHIKNY